MGSCLSCLGSNLAHCCSSIFCCFTFNTCRGRQTPPYRECTGKADGNNRGRECPAGALTPGPCISQRMHSGVWYCVACGRDY